MNKYYHLVGIKGAGMSGLAAILKSQGTHLTGSDVPEIFFTDEILKNLKIPVFQRFDSINIGKPDLVIASAAYGDENPEIKEAKRKGIKILFYPQMLGRLMNKKYGIAVCGTHGKTTTTALAGLLLEKGGFDPTVVVGSYVNHFSGNARVGKSKYFVVEACEYKKHFLNYNPQIIILTNIEMDHPDFYKDLKEVKSAFLEFTHKLPPDGLLIYGADNKNAAEIVKKIIRQMQWINLGLKNKDIISYGFSDKANVKANNIKINPGKITFEAFLKNKKLGEFKLKIPGRHNIENALAVIALGLKLNINIETIKKVIENYSGIKRRFELIKKVKGITFIDDYAHHPTEISATLKGAREFYPKQKIWCIFQPHTFSRTKELLGDFSKSFKESDFTIICDIFSSAREKNTHNVSSKDIVDRAKKENIIYIGKSLDVVSYITPKLNSGDIVITMGAGDVYKIGEMIIKNLEGKG